MADLLVNVNEGADTLTPHLVKIEQLLGQIIVNTQKLGAANRKAAGDTDALGKSAENAGNALNHFNRHSKLSAENVRSMGDVMRLIKGDLENFSFNVWKVAMNVTLWSGVFTAAAVGVEKLVSQGAKFNALREGFDNMASAQGHSAAAIMENTKKSTLGLISEMDIMKNYNAAIALHVNVNEKSFATLSGAAVKMSRVMGVDVNHALDSLITGLGRQSIRVLDNIGIIMKSQEAYKAYADEHHKLASALTDEEKRVAFFNMAIQRLEENAAKSGASVMTLGEAFVQAKTALGDTLAKTMAYVVTGNAGSAAAQDFTGAMKDATDAIWKQRDAIRDVIISMTDFGKTVLSTTTTVVSFVAEHKTFIESVLAAMVVGKLVPMIISWGTALAGVIVGLGTLTLSVGGVITVIIALGAALVLAIRNLADLTDVAKKAQDGALKYDWWDTFSEKVARVGLSFKSLGQNIMWATSAMSYYTSAGLNSQAKADMVTWGAAIKETDAELARNRTAMDLAAGAQARYDVGVQKEMAAAQKYGDMLGLVHAKFGTIAAAKLAQDLALKNRSLFWKQIESLDKEGVVITTDMLKGMSANGPTTAKPTTVDPAAGKTKGKSIWDWLGMPDPADLTKEADSYTKAISLAVKTGFDRNVIDQNYAEKIRGWFKQMFPDETQVRPVTEMFAMMAEPLKKMGAHLAALPSAYQDLIYQKKLDENQTKLLNNAYKDLAQEMGRQAHLLKELASANDAMLTKIAEKADAFGKIFEKAKSPAEQLNQKIQEQRKELDGLIDSYAKAEPAMRIADPAMADGMLHQIDVLKQMRAEIDGVAQESIPGMISAMVDRGLPGVANFFMGFTASIQSTGEILKDFGQQMEETFSTGLTNIGMAVLTHSGNIKKIFQDMGKAILSTIVGMLAQMAVKYGASKLGMMAIDKTAAAGQKAAEATKASASASAATASTSAAIAEIFEAHAYIPFAGVGIAAGFVSAMLGLMAGFNAAALGMSVLSNTAGGMLAPNHKQGLWEVPGGVDSPYPATLHGKEMVVQAPQAEKIRQFVERTTGGRSESDKTTAAVLGGSIGGVLDRGISIPMTFVSDVLVTDGADANRKVARQITEHVVEEIHRKIKNGEFVLDAYNTRGG